MVAINDIVEATDIATAEAIVETEGIVREYEDGANFPGDDTALAAERAYRCDFVEEARRIVRVWAHPPGPPPPPDFKPKSVRELIAKRRCAPYDEMEASWKQRQRLRERYTVYGSGDAGPKTYHLGYRPGHEVPAARLRGRHHAMAYVLNIWEDLATSDLDIFDPKLLCPWLRAVERWAAAPIRPNRSVPPPRPLEVTPEFEHLEVVPECEETEPIVALAPRGNLTPFLPSPPLLSLSPPPMPSLPLLPPPPAPPLALPAPPPPPRIKLTRADQIEVRPPQWLLRGMIERDSFALIFGDPGCGKSFLAIDWACRIATGTPWHGHAVKRGPVVYVAGEGQQGFGRRIQAWSEHHGVSLENMPLYSAPAVAIPDPSDVAALIETIDFHVAVGAAAVGNPSLVVIDTLARCFGGDDESATQDMNKFVAACDVIRRRYGCTILVVHHAGHGDKSRARGAIALKAALDTEYRLENDNGLLLTATKMKEAEMPPPLAMKLVSVTLPDMLDDDGNPVTSAAIEVLDTSAIIAKATAASQEKEYSKWQALGLDIAKRLVTEGSDGQVSVKAWHAACEALGMRQSTRYNVLTKLCTKGVLALDGETLSVF
jgi:hypothetical protein